MNIFRWLYWKIMLGNRPERMLRYMADRFDEWHKANCPELSREEALKRYDGITIQELLENVK